MRRLIFVYEAEHELLYTSSWTILDGVFFAKMCICTPFQPLISKAGMPPTANYISDPNLGESRKSPENDIVDKN